MYQINVKNKSDCFKIKISQCRVVIVSFNQQKVYLKGANQKFICKCVAKNRKYVLPHIQNLYNNILLFNFYWSPVLFYFWQRNKTAIFFCISPERLKTVMAKCVLNIKDKHKLFICKITIIIIFFTSLGMNKYYSLSPSSKPEIHSLLSPIFEAVRKNKIHSYHQLQNHQQHQQLSLTKQPNKINYIFERKPKTAHSKVISDIFDKSDKSIKVGNQTMYSRIDHKLNEQSRSKQLSQLRKTTKKVYRETNGFECRGKSSGNSASKTLYNKMFRVNSKIKKHLVEYIDFEEIEKMFYKKRDMMTRYQYFLKLKNQNKDKEKPNHHRRTRSKQIYIDSSNFHEQKNQQIPEYSPTMESFRSNGNSVGLKSPQKKKFWGRQNHPKKLIILDIAENIVSGKTIEV